MSLAVARGRQVEPARRPAAVAWSQRGGCAGVAGDLRRSGLSRAAAGEEPVGSAVLQGLAARAADLAGWAAPIAEEAEPASLEESAARVGSACFAGGAGGAGGWTCLAVEVARRLNLLCGRLGLFCRWRRCAGETAGGTCFAGGTGCAGARPALGGRRSRLRRGSWWLNLLCRRRSRFRPRGGRLALLLRATAGLPGSSFRTAAVRGAIGLVGRLLLLSQKSLAGVEGRGHARHREQGERRDDGSSGKEESSSSCDWDRFEGERLGP